MSKYINVVHEDLRTVCTFCDKTRTCQKWLHWKRSYVLFLGLHCVYNFIEHVTLDEIFSASEPGCIFNVVASRLMP